MLKLASAASALVMTDTFSGPFVGRSGVTNSTPVSYAEPLDEDDPADTVITITHRQLARIVLLAAETGGRFEREGLRVDPLAWLYGARDLFDGLTAIQACQQRAPFVRAVLLHSLSIGLDADPEEVDELLSGEDLGGTMIHAGHVETAEVIQIPIGDDK